MFFQSFHDKFPVIAEAETRTIMVFENNDFGLPADSYTFVELFCNDPKCDCRRVFFQVFSEKRGKSEAVIYWGWENAAFYRKWMGYANKQMLTELIGPGLNVGSPQSNLAPALLNMCAKVLLNDNTYTNRVKNHYAMFKKNK
ncbi:MAG: hypothetical protein ABIJ97_16235 [Bacteroidota bacterium]